VASEGHSPFSKRALFRTRDASWSSIVLLWHLELDESLKGSQQLDQLGTRPLGDVEDGEGRGGRQQLLLYLLLYVEIIVSASLAITGTPANTGPQPYPYPAVIQFLLRFVKLVRFVFCLGDTILWLSTDRKREREGE
jgi:hypothetical protein